MMNGLVGSQAPMQSAKSNPPNHLSEVNHGFGFSAVMVEL